MNIIESTKQYEKWLRGYTPLVEKDLKLKHQLMAQDRFSFFRATFYRWAQLWQEKCPDTTFTPQVLGVGDLHVENFGTWRDSEGRLVWGINDFDEAEWIPYTLDLVRLAASAQIAPLERHLSLYKEPDTYILQGYIKGLEEGGEPFVLAEKHSWLRRQAQGDLRDPVKFWKKLEKGRTVQVIPSDASLCLSYLPKPYRLVRRISGLGSLGRPRYVGIASLNGGNIAREVKSLTPSAINWARGNNNNVIFYSSIVREAIRQRDPYLGLSGNWVSRRLSPDCCRITLAELPDERDEVKLLKAMGYETANIHLGLGKPQEILRDLKKRPKHWLRHAVKAMVAATTKDWEEWKK